ncbi:unnamed protein product [Caenorhabditis sp. 36 PRJEB53466]|nr:unnamed protein product [Caenorhabditis sp. 36 PRJEB53466]
MLSKLNFEFPEEKKPSFNEPLKPPQFARLRDGPMMRGLTDLPPDGGASTSAAGNFVRQDSLALAASYQQRDRERQNIDFMEAELDLDNYLACFTDLDVPADNVDFDDAELQKVNILYDGEQPYTEPPPMNGYERHVAYTSGFSKPEDFDNDSYKMNCEVKSEQPDYDTKTRRLIKKPMNYQLYEQHYNDSSDLSDDPSVDDSYYEPISKKKKSNGVDHFKPSTRARKYNLKPVEEKAEPTYKLKRARNNDAVRKSRNKAKEMQKKKEEEHNKMKKRIAELEGLLASEREARRRDQELLEQLLRAKGMKDGHTRNALENYNK